METFASSDDFLKSFGSIENHGFINPIFLADTKIGFSVQKYYPQDIRFKPAIGQTTKKPDDLSIMWVVFGDKNQNEKTGSSGLIKLTIRIATMSTYRSKYWDYDFKDDKRDCPSKESLEASLATPRPLELDFEDDYFYNIEKKCFVDKYGAEISGVDILEEVFKKHCKTVHLWFGFGLRIKLAWRSKVPGLIGLLILSIVFLLKHSFGRTLENSADISGIFKIYKTEALKKLDSDSMNLLGYKASKQVMILFCVTAIFISAYLYRMPTANNYYNWLENKQFLFAAHGILLLWLLDAIIPWMLFWVMNFLISVRYKIMFMKLRF